MILIRQLPIGGGIPSVTVHDLRAVAEQLASASAMTVPEAFEVLMRITSATQVEAEALEQMQRTTVRSAWSTGWHALLVDLPPALFLVFAGWFERLGHMFLRGLRAVKRGTVRAVRWIAERARAARARRRAHEERLKCLAESNDRLAESLRALERQTAVLIENRAKLEELQVRLEGWRPLDPGALRRDP